MNDLFNTPPAGVPADVVRLFEKAALTTYRAGFDKYSARTICEVLRWREHIEHGNRDFKINNNWIPSLARWFVVKHRCPGFFELRGS